MKRLAYLLIVSTTLIFPGLAQPQQQEEEDGPGRGVARLSVLNGDVSIRRGDSGDVVAAALNAPLVVLDRVLTGPQSRAELQFDYSNLIRMGANAEIRLSELEYKRYQIQIALGTTTFRVLRNSDSQVELSTPSVALRPLRQGVYRVTVHEDGSSEITVRSGEAEVSTPNGSERLAPGRTMLARGSANEPEFQVVGSLPLDDWDRWNENRDRDLQRSHSYNYVSPDISGAEDLEGYGSWVDVPTYGRVWHPTVVADWAPYRAGRWVWMDYYGWTWVSYDPWGWAPYHYGRWLSDPRYGWCWWPGGPSRHYWRPALVAFFGWGNYGGYRSGIGFGFGNVGWVPLAPYEPFHPWYGRGGYGGFRGGTTIVNNTTIINNTNISSVYRNARVNNGITGMSSDQFGRGHVTTASYMRVSSGDIQSAGLVRGQLPLTPGRESLRMADRPVTGGVSRVPENRSFYSRRAATQVDRVPFEQQRQSIDQAARRTFGDGAVRGQAVAPSASTPANAGGWRRSGEQQPAVAPRGSDNSNWHRFGEPGQHTRTDSPAATAPQADRNSFSSRPANPDAVGRTAAPADNGGGNWRSFGTPAPSGRREGNSIQPAPRVSQDSYRAPAPQARQPQQQQNEERYRGYSSPARDSAPVRINPPIVRERSAPSAPPARMENSRPSYSAPRTESSRPAPRSEAPRGGGGDRGGGKSGGDRGGRGH